MADVESMYYQVMVPDNQWVFLKSSWWNDSNLLKEKQDFVMRTHVFGRIHLQLFKLHSLRRSATDNDSIFGKATSEELQKNSM